MVLPLPEPLPLSRSFARLLGLEVRGRGPCFYIVCNGEPAGSNHTLADHLTAREVAGYLNAYDLANLAASGACCPLDRIGTAT